MKSKPVKEVKEIVVVSVRMVPVGRVGIGHIESKVFLADVGWAGLSTKVQSWVDRYAPSEVSDSMTLPSFTLIDMGTIRAAGWSREMGWHPARETPTRAGEYLVLLQDKKKNIVGIDITVWTGSEWYMHKKVAVSAWHNLPDLPNLRELESHELLESNTESESVGSKSE